MNRLKIFISSTMTDLQAERQAVEQAIAELRLEAVRAETIGSQPVSSRQACLEMARQCDIYLGIYGARYGWVPPGDQVSVTKMELQEAREQGKDILVYVKDVPEREEAQEEFLQRVEDFDEGFFRRPYFTTPEQLAEWVREDIAALVSRRYRVEEMPGYLRRVFSDYPWIAVFTTAAMFSLLTIALSFDLIRRLLMVKPSLAEWSAVIVLGLLSLLVVGSTLTLTGRRAFLKERIVSSKQAGWTKLLISISILWLIALSVAWFMRPALARYYNNKGALAHKAGKGEAQDYYRRAIIWNPDDTVALFNLGTIYEEIGECEKAVGWYEKAVESDCAFAPAYNNLARLYISELCPTVQDPRRAGTLLETARKRLQKQPVSPEFSTEVNYTIAKNLGWAYLVEGEERYADAGRELRAAINLVEERAAAHCLLAQVLEKTMPDDKHAVLREWRDCLAFGPDTTLYEENRWASMARERLGGQ